jgi:hypothetical protein
VEPNQDNAETAEETVEDAKKTEATTSATSVAAAATSQSTQSTSPPTPDPDESTISSLVKDLKVTSLVDQKLDPPSTDHVSRGNGTVVDGDKTEEGSAEGKPRKWLGVW